MSKKKHEYLKEVIAALPPHTVAIETGRIRSKRIGEGYSTKWLAQCANIETLYSIDHNPMTQLVCQEVVDAQFLVNVHFINADSEQALRTIEGILATQVIGFILFDSANDPIVTMREFLAILPALADGCIIVVDDVHCKFGFKGDLLLPKLEKYGCVFEQQGDYAVTRFHR